MLVGAIDVIFRSERLPTNEKNKTNTKLDEIMYAITPAQRDNNNYAQEEEWIYIGEQRVGRDQ